MSTELRAGGLMPVKVSVELPRWRHLASILLPVEFAVASNNRTHHCSIYEFLFELRPAVHQAHVDGNNDKLARAYAFAEWGLQHTNKQIWNAVGVAFYEHVFDDGADIDSVLAWISPRTRQAIEGLWEQMLPAERFLLVQHAAKKVRWSHQRECDAALDFALTELDEN